MSWLRDFLVDTLEVEVPSPIVKWVILVMGALVGGYVFAHSGSWLEAWRWYLFAAFIIWCAAKFAELIGEYVVKAILFLIP